MPSKTINVLTNLRTVEVSLVRRGANNKRIGLTKSAEDRNKMTFQELLANVLDTVAEGEEKLLESLKAQGLGDEEIQIAKASYRMQNGFRDKLDTNSFAAVAKASGYTVEKEIVKSEMNDEMKAVVKAQNVEIAQLRKSSDEKDAKIESIQKTAERKELIVKCEKLYSHVPGMSIDEMADTLQKAYGQDEEFGKSIEKQWAATEEAVKTGSVLKSAGVTPSTDPQSAEGQLQTIAKSLTESDSSLAYGAAYTQAIKQNPELYEQYLSDRG